MVCQLLEFFLDYVHGYCLQMNAPGRIVLPNFIFNSFANVISILFKKQLTLGDYQASYFLILRNKFFEEETADNLQLVKMGLKIFNYLMDNMLIDTESIGYFNYRKLINIFQHNMLFNIMDITKKTCKFLIASEMNLQQLLLVSNPRAQGSNPNGLDGMMTSTHGEKIFNSTNLLFGRVASQSNTNF